MPSDSIHGRPMPIQSDSMVLYSILQNIIGRANIKLGNRVLKLTTQ